MDKLYKFEELSKESQESAINNYYQLNVEGDWYDFIISDAYHNCHLVIKDFGDIDREGYIVCDFIWDAENSAEAILSDRNDKKEIKQFATDFLNSSRDEESEKLFLSKLEKSYLRDLIDEYISLTDEEEIRKSLISGDYDFLENGGIVF